VVWTGLTWLRIGTSGGLLWTRYWTFWFHKMLGSSWVAAQLAASQEELSSMSERAIKQRMRRSHVAGNWARKKVYKILIGKSEGTRHLGHKSREMWNTRGVRLDSTALRIGSCRWPLWTFGFDGRRMHLRNSLSKRAPVQLSEFRSKGKLVWHVPIFSFAYFCAEVRNGHTQLRVEMAARRPNK
jgi:hypothetical protein